MSKQKVRLYSAASVVALGLALAVGQAISGVPVQPAYAGDTTTPPSTTPHPPPRPHPPRPHPPRPHPPRLHPARRHPPRPSPRTRSSRTTAITGGGTAGMTAPIKVATTVAACRKAATVLVSRSPTARSPTPSGEALLG